jgi:hypothetical protein
MSDLLETCPALTAIPAGQYRLLAQIMVLGFLCIFKTADGGNFAVDTAGFLNDLRDEGFHVEGTGHQMVISVVQ